MFTMFTEFEKAILVKLLDQASEEMSNNVCNDFPIVVTKENVDDIDRLIQDTAMDADHDRSLSSQMNNVGDKVYFQDWILLDHFKAKIQAC